MRGRSAQITIAYAGESLQDGTIDVRDLAPALLAIGQLFEEANRVLNGDSASVQVTVKATDRGSFEVTLEVIQRLAKQLSTLLGPEPLQTATALKELLGFGSAATGLLWLIKKLRGGPAKALPSAKKGHIRIEIEGEILEISEQLGALYEQIPVRIAASKMLEPLRREGIEKFETRDDGEPVQTIEKRELPLYEPPTSSEAAEVLPECSWEQAYTIISVTFKDENKWRLSDGSNSLNATITDRDFLRDVDEGRVSFTKGDSLQCLVVMRQSFAADGQLRTEYEVTKVLAHRKRARQIRLIH